MSVESSNKRFLSELQTVAPTKEDTIRILEEYIRQHKKIKPSEDQSVCNNSTGLAAACGYMNDVKSTFVFRDAIPIDAEYIAKYVSCVQAIGSIRGHLLHNKEAGVLLTYGKNMFCACGHVVLNDDSRVLDPEEDSVSADGKYIMDDGDVFYPKVVDYVKDVLFVQVACGGGPHTACVSVDGKCYTFGSGESGQLGRGTAYLSIEDEFVPTAVAGVLQPEFIVMVACGTSHTVFLTDKGELFVCGIYRSISEAIGLTPDVRKSIDPVKVPVPNVRFVKVVSGSDHTLALTDGGSVYSFGCGETGVLGRLNCETVQDCLTPSLVALTDSNGQSLMWSDIYTGHFASFALTADGSIYAFGVNQGGQLGLDRANPPTPNDIRNLPTKIDFFTNEKSVKSVYGGEQHTVFTCTNGQVYCAGQGMYGRLGTGDNTDSIAPFNTVYNTPDAVHNPQLASVDTNNLQAVAGVDNATMGAASLVSSACITSDSQLYTWGSGSNYLLGNADEDIDAHIPTKLAHGDHHKFKSIIQIAMGPDQIAILCKK